MEGAKVLLTSAYGPFDTYGFDEPIWDAFSNRLTKGQDIFTMTGHFHIPPLHTLAQNIDQPCVVLETPTMEVFENELKNGDYDYVGITCNIVHMEKIFKMGRKVRELSPKTKVILGGYGIQCLNEVFNTDEDLKEVADYTCHGEGVRFMRKILGEEPLKRPLLECGPSCDSAPKWADDFQLAPLSMGFLTGGLGCPNLCEFCSTSHFYDGEYIEMSDADNLFKGIKNYWKNHNATSVIWDEDFPQKRERFLALGKLFQKDEEFGMKLPPYFTFASIKALSEYSPEELLLSGLGVAWIGIESLFSDLGKRKGSDVKTVFNDLHNAGIMTIGSWIGGWDFHDRVNILEDREFFLSLRPVFSQLSQLLPLPETALWERLKEEGRLYDDVPWKDFHFYGGAYKYKNFERHEMIYFIEDMYKKLYEYAGSTMIRILEYNMNGYEFCKKSNKKILNQDRAEFYEGINFFLWPMLKVNETFAPNGFVRSRIKELGKRYRAVHGTPNQNQYAMQEYFLKKATDYKRSLDTYPPVDEDKTYVLPKRYVYGTNKLDLVEQGKKPYAVSYPAGMPPKR